MSIQLVNLGLTGYYKQPTRSERQCANVTHILPLGPILLSLAVGMYNKEFENMPPKYSSNHPLYCSTLDVHFIL